MVSVVASADLSINATAIIISTAAYVATATPPRGAVATVAPSGATEGSVGDNIVACGRLGMLGMLGSRGWCGGVDRRDELQQRCTTSAVGNVSAGSRVRRSHHIGSRAACSRARRCKCIISGITRDIGAVNIVRRRQGRRGVVVAVAHGSTLAVDSVGRFITEGAR